jgi:hypothetical protein
MLALRTRLVVFALVLAVAGVAVLVLLPRLERTIGQVERIAHSQGGLARGLAQEIFTTATRSATAPRPGSGGRPAGRPARLAGVRRPPGRPARVARSPAGGGGGFGSVVLWLAVVSLGLLGGWCRTGVGDLLEWPGSRGWLAVW